MIDAIVDWYWYVFGIGKENMAFGSQIAALFSWLMLIATSVAALRYRCGQLPFFLVVSFLIVSLSYFATDILIAGIYNFYRFFDGDNKFISVSISYTILDSLTAVLIMLLARRLCNQANHYMYAVDLIVRILLINGAAHFIVNGYLVLRAEDVPVVVAMCYSSIILINDTLLIVTMFVPSFATKLQTLFSTKLSKKMGVILRPD